jgi:subfamily B ATP-binding cassette protein MsbA
MMIPILDILFDKAKDVHDLMPWAMNLDAIKHNLYYYITQFKDTNGPGLALLLIGLFVILATLLKVGFAYLAAFEAVYIRNGVVKDMREQIYHKILKLALPFFSEERKGDIISRITGDVTEVENSIMSSLDMFEKSDHHFCIAGFDARYEPEPDALYFSGATDRWFYHRTSGQITQKSFARGSG